MKKFNVTLAGLFAVNCLFAQVTILEENFTPTGVSNDGFVVGYYDQSSPYSLWNPESGEMTEIGGVSAGNGIGGKAKFSVDGKYISGTMWTEWAYSKEWEKNTLTDYPYTFDHICNVPRMTDMMFAVGYDANDDKGVVLTSMDGKFWSRSVESQKGLEAICFLTDAVGIVGGKDGMFAYTTNRGNSWQSIDPRPEGCNDVIASYKTIDFIQEEPYYGVVGAELADGKFTAYQSSDGAETWTQTTGITSVPLCITHVNDIFYMGTKEGHILKSTDHGITWEKIFTSGGFLQPIMPIHKIKFANANIGIATTNTFIYRTTDGGATWKVNVVDDNISQKASLYDAVWIDENNVIIVGSEGYAYSSVDAGATWTRLNIEPDGISDLKSIVMTENTLAIGGINGNLYHQKLTDKTTVGSMGKYDITTNEWIPLGNLGCISDGISISSGYAISGDGKTVVGLASTGQPNQASIGRYSHAIAWNEEKGTIDLGSLFDNKGRSTRANVVNYDGSVIAGWQDERGPWHSAIWRKNTEGGYTPNEYILIDPEADPKSDDNHAMQAEAISLDGKWIGGSGRSIQSGPLSILSDDQLIANQAWIWSEETGFKRLGMISELENNEAAVAHVSGINNDGTTVVGFIEVGNFMYGFIWTKDGGIMSINTYLADIMKYNIGEYHYASILDMSPNGRYITGWGINNNTSSLFTCQIDLLYNPASIQTPGKAESIATIYPNPVSDVLHIDLPFEGEAQIRLVDVQGRIVINEKTYTSQNSYPVNTIESGLYILEVVTEGMHRTYKIKINH